MIGRGVVRSGGGELTGGVGSGDPGVAASTHVAGDVAAGMTGGAGGAVGSFRTEEGTSGRGASSAIRASISELARSEEHTSELQSRQYLVCRLLLEKKKKKESGAVGRQ